VSEPINLFEYETLASQSLSPMARDYYASGAWDETTLRDNRAAYERYKLRPRVLVDVSQRDLSAEVMGQQLSLPILVAPMAFQCFATPEGEVATAKAVAALGTAMVLSTMSTQSLETVAQTPCKRWFQLYVHRDRALTKDLVQRAESAGYSALCVTVDSPVLGCRERDERNEFILPPGLSLANLTTMELPAVAQQSGLLAYFIQEIDPSLTWKDLEWLQSITHLPIAVKGILRGDDALRAAEFGASAAIVSNHGGRQLDGAIATIDALGEVVEVAGGKIDILLDGGIRRGTDVLKAIALGAKAVLVGRPILWGLAVNGEWGARRVLELLRNELDVAMALSGCATIADIDMSLVKPTH